MSELTYYKDYLQELVKIKTSLERLHIDRVLDGITNLQARLERHINMVSGGKDEEITLLTRKESAKVMGISIRQFDRISKKYHLWRYRNEDGTHIRYNAADFTLTKDELKDKWIKGMLTKQIDENCNVIRKPSAIIDTREAKALRRRLDEIENDMHCS